ncbi:TPA: hypothetical protein EYP45_00255 [Candidatus Peregrinibacteria bacterium]|nr:hypothetical protein [Candidatus Peregrinibacteria bacterium]HIQ57149.1 hypothetical protein [Candidatus Gracilibacteria bacterium]
MKFTLDLGGSTIDLLYTKNNKKEFHSLESKLFNKNIKNFTEQKEIEKLENILESFNVFKILMTSNSLNNKNILIITGGFSSNIQQNTKQIHTVTLKNQLFLIQIVSEFTAIGRGAHICSNKKSGIAVSMGTGTAMVYFNAEHHKYEHIKGTGLGGGTFIGLSTALLNISDFQEISNLALLGQKQNIDLSIGDIVRGSIPLLPASSTASNFAKYSKDTSHADIALGISTMIAESITTLAIEKCLRYKQTHIIFGGKFSKLSILQKHVKTTTKLFNITAIFPKNSEYMTVIGASEII